MELGQKLKAARLEANLSQRQLCDGIVTRNMLSQIENGAAQPSMDTLRQFAARLGKTMSYFLEDEAVTSPNQTVMESARNRFKSMDFAAVSEELAHYRSPDPVFDPEYYLLLGLCRMEQAQHAITENRLPYAENLLAQAADALKNTPYFTPALERERLLLLAQTTAVVTLRADDRELLLRAETALRERDFPRCLQLLDAAEDQDASKWQLLRGEACFGAKDYQSAARHLTLAEESYPNQTIPKLEICYRELKIFEKAYEYACKQR
jgi:transcriptional regulator with XRE-family HTH domain